MGRTCLNAIRRPGGMHNAFLVGAAVALAGAGTALITKKGTGTAAAHTGT